MRASFDGGLQHGKAVKPAPSPRSADARYISNWRRSRSIVPDGGSNRGKCVYLKVQSKPDNNCDRVRGVNIVDMGKFAAGVVKMWHEWGPEVSFVK